MKQKLRLLLALSVVFLLICCKSTDDKMNEFVASYNSAAASFSNSVLTHTSAKKVSNNEIRILLKTNQEPNKDGNSLYVNALSSMVAGIVKSEKSVIDLTDEGVKLHFIMLADDDSELGSLLVDKKKLVEIMNEESQVALPSQSHLSPQLQEMLKFLNKSLPIVDKEAGTKVVAITIDKDMTLIYEVEVNESMAKNLKGEGMASILKENLMREPGVKRMLPELRTYGISTITYKYKNEKGDVVNEASISANELR